MGQERKGPEEMGRLVSCEKSDLEPLRPPTSDQPGTMSRSVDERTIIKVPGRSLHPQGMGTGELTLETCVELEFEIKRNPNSCLERNPGDRIENLKEMPSLVKGREEGIQKDDQARGPHCRWALQNLGTVGGLTIRRGIDPGASAS